MSIYLIAGESIRQIEEETEKLSKIAKNKEVFDLNTMEIIDLITEASYPSLFGDKKMIIAKNASIFGGNKSSEKEIDLLLHYFEEPNENTTLIFTYNGKIDMRKKITKKIAENYKLINLEKLNNNMLSLKIKEVFKKDGFVIDNESINYMINACLNNYDLIYNEIEKIKTYYINPCKIELHDVKNIVPKTYDDNQFKFVEAVINKDIKRAFELLEDLSALKVEPISLINLLAREYRLMHIIKTLYEEKESLVNISKKCKLQNWQTEKILKNSFAYTFSELENHLLVLNDCDLEMKKVYFDKYTILKSFLLQILD